MNSLKPVISQSGKRFYFNGLQVAAVLLYRLRQMPGVYMLRIQRTSNGKVVFRVSGRIALDDIDELRRLFSLEPSTVHVVLNLKELVLADGDAVEFLAGCEAAGMTLNDCPTYVRMWIDLEWGQNK